MRRTVSTSIGCVDTGGTTPLTLMLIGAPQEMNRSEACFSAISLNSRSRYMVAPRELRMRRRDRAIAADVGVHARCHGMSRFHDNVMN